MMMLVFYCAVTVCCAYAELPLLSIAILSLSPVRPCTLVPCVPHRSLHPRPLCPSPVPAPLSSVCLTVGSPAAGEPGPVRASLGALSEPRQGERGRLLPLPLAQLHGLVCVRGQRQRVSLPRLPAAQLPHVQVRRRSARRHSRRGAAAGRGGCLLDVAGEKGGTGGSEILSVSR